MYGRGIGCETVQGESGRESRTESFVNSKGIRKRRGRVYFKNWRADCQGNEVSEELRFALILEPIS